VLGGEEAPPFTAITEKLRPPVPGRAKAIRQAAKVNTRPPVISKKNTAKNAGLRGVDPRRAA
jgi:hypothetical protein